MQFIEDDIDQLYRRASEEYPLKSKARDWPKVLNAIREKKKEKRRLFFFPFFTASVFTALLFLTPFKIVSNQAPSAIIVHPIAKVQQDVVSFATANKNGSDKKLITGSENKIYAATKAISIIGKQTEQSENKIIIAVSSQELRALSAEGNRSVYLQPSGMYGSIKPAGMIRVTEIMSALPRHDIVAASVNKSDLFYDKHHSHGYLGLTVGADISSVKLQQTSKVGYSAGIVLGYQWRKKISIETGLTIDRKYYYSEGEYFNPKLIPSINIETVKGKCIMFEIPLNINYKLSRGEDKVWSVTTGISSYLMKREDYRFQYTTTSAILMDGFNDYENPDNNWFSVMNVGTSYTKKIGAFGSVRIGSYFQIPFHGLGIGKLPISSAGMNVTLFKNVF